MSLNRRLRTIIVVIAAVWALLMVVFAPQFISLWKQRTIADQAFQQYTASLISGDYSTAYGLCGRKFRDATSYEVFVAQQKLLQSTHGRLKTIRKGQFTIHGHNERMTAVINAEFVYERDVITFILRFEPSQQHWELYGYKQAE